MNYTIAQKKRIVQLAEEGRFPALSPEEVVELRGMYEDLVKSKRKSRKLMDVTTDIPMELRRRLTYTPFLDVGKGAEAALDIPESTLRKAIQLLVKEGYHLFYLMQTQEGTLKTTTLKVLGRPATTYNELLGNRDKIEAIS